MLQCYNCIKKKPYVYVDKLLVILHMELLFLSDLWWSIYLLGGWMSEWSADGMNVIVLHELRATQVENWTVLSCYEAYIYYDRSVWERRERQERQDRNRVSVWKTAWLQSDWREWVEGTQKTSNQQRANQQHYINKNFQSSRLLSYGLCVHGSLTTTRNRLLQSRLTGGCNV